MKRILAVMMIVSVVLSMFAVFTPKAIASENVIFQDDFESYAVGTFPSAGGWSIVWNGAGNQYQVVTDFYYSSPTKSLQLMGSYGWSVVVKKDFSSSSNLIGYETRLMASEGGGGSVAFCNIPIETWGRYYAMVGFGTDGFIWACSRNNEGYQQLQPFTPYSWYKIRVLIDRSARVYDVWIDDVLRGEDIPIYYDPWEILSLQFQVGWVSIKNYFDDVKVFEARAPLPTRFSPSINGFGFNNYDIKPGCRAYTLAEICDKVAQWQSIPSELKETYAQVLMGLCIFYIIAHQNGHCYGISSTSIDYYYHPEDLPLGYKCANDVKEYDASTDVLQKIEAAHDTQINAESMKQNIVYNMIIKENPLMLRLEIEAIKSLLDQGKPALVNMYGSWNQNGQSGNGLHSVVAYDYSVVGTETLIKFYDCNNGTKHEFNDHDRTMKFSYDSQGEYSILDDGDKIINYEYVFLASDPTTSWTTIKDNIGDLLDWLRDKLSELWDTISLFAIEAPQRFADFVNWLAQNAKDIWAKIVQIKLFSHAQLHVYSSDGRHVGLTHSGELDQGFDAMFLESNEMQYCLMPNPETGAYVIKLIGVSNGSYTLSIESFAQGHAIKQEIVTSEICEGEIHEHRFWLSPTADLVLDDVPPVTKLVISEPEYTSSMTYVAADTLFTLEATDNDSGVHSTVWKVFNATYDGGWQTYTTPFSLTFLADGTYTIAFNSTDNAGNVEPTNTIQVTLFSWTNIFTDSYGRGTTLKINTAYKLFQFIAPDKTFPLKQDPKMCVYKHIIAINYADSGMRLIAAAVDYKIDFCSAIARDEQTRKTYWLIEHPST